MDLISFDRKDIELLLHHLGGKLKGKKILMIGEPYPAIAELLRISYGAKVHCIDREKRPEVRLDRNTRRFMHFGDAKDLLRIFRNTHYDVIMSKNTMTVHALGPGNRSTRMGEALSIIAGRGGPSHREMADRELKAREDAEQIHLAAYNLLEKGGIAIHTCDIQEDSLIHEFNSLENIGYKVLSDKTKGKCEMVLKRE